MTSTVLTPQGFVAKWRGVRQSERAERGNRIPIISAREATPRESRSSMSTAQTSPGRDDEELLDEYEFGGGVRGKYAARYAAGTNIVVLSPDVAEIFPTSQAVNDALRALTELARCQTHRAAG